MKRKGYPICKYSTHVTNVVPRLPSKGNYGDDEVILSSGKAHIVSEILTSSSPSVCEGNEKKKQKRKMYVIE